MTHPKTGFPSARSFRLSLCSEFLLASLRLSLLSQIEYEATVLEPVQQGPEEPRGAFVRRVQRSIADAGGLTISECTISVKKRLMQEASSASSAAASGRGSKSRAAGTIRMRS